MHKVVYEMATMEATTPYDSPAHMFHWPFVLIQALWAIKCFSNFGSYFTLTPSCHNHLLLTPGPGDPCLHSFAQCSDTVLTLVNSNRDEVFTFQWGCAAWIGLVNVHACRGCYGFWSFRSAVILSFNLIIARMTHSYRKQLHWLHFGTH